MPDLDWYDLIETPAGWIVAAGDADSLRELGFPMEDRNSALFTAEADYPSVERGCPEKLRGLLEHYLRDYFTGRSPATTLPLKLDGLTPFTIRVLEETARIPWGEVASYGEIADRMGSPRAARAVGQALNRNPIPIVIPCHRVITSDNKIGGFGGNLCMKRRLLKLEGVEVD
jgi:O-6-methylguanine DNA methyltransferase